MSEGLKIPTLSLHPRGACPIPETTPDDSGKATHELVIIVVVIVLDSRYRPVVIDSDQEVAARCVEESGDRRWNCPDKRCPPWPVFAKGREPFLINWSIIIIRALLLPAVRSSDLFSGRFGMFVTHSLRIRGALVVGILAVLAAPSLIAQEPKNPALDAAHKQAIVDEVSKLLEDNYIFPETSRKIEDYIRTRLKNGDYDKLSGSREFAEAVSADLLTMGKDKHMGFAYAPERAAEIRRLESRSEDEAKAARERRLAAAKNDNFGFRKVERLSGNVGYLDFRYFGSAEDAGPTMIAAMNFLAYCDAVIVDLRQNGGGDTTGIQLLCSYFFPEMTHLNDIRYRDEAKDENYWTLPYVPGPKPVNADLYILTSSRTFSGAEEFSYNMKNLKRGTIIGETTGGGAHPTDAKIVQNDFILRVPFARAVNPYSKTNWEGTGVAPDVQVPAAEAFDRAYRMAVEKLAAKAADARQKAEYEWIIVGLDARAHPVRVEPKVLKTYAGVYGDRKFTFENGSLFYQRTGPKFRLIPMTQTLFALEGLDNFRVEFELKDGKAVGLVGLNDAGGRQPSPRTK
jgi:hypothetical protein